MLVHQAASEDDDEAAKSPDEVCIHARARPSPAPALRPRRPPPCWPAPLVQMHVTLPTLPAPVHAERLFCPVLVHQPAAEDDDEASNNTDEVCIHARVPLARPRIASMPPAPLLASPPRADARDPSDPPRLFAC